jgi:hypothetical protein
MRYLLMIIFWSITFFSSSSHAADAPTSIAGIKLGADISSVHHSCKLTTDIPLSDERHLNEITMKSQIVPGIKGGTIAYANCSKKGAIVRVKLKFDNPSREFFDDLLKRYTQNFGKPDNWRGNPFQTIISWKWSFKNKSGEAINLELTHSDDEDYKTGNFVKLTHRSLWEQEALCYSRLAGSAGGEPSPPTPASQLNYEQLIPQ